MSYRSPLEGYSLLDGLFRLLKFVLISGLVLLAFIFTSFVGVGLLLGWLVFRLIRRWRSPAKPVHGPQVLEGEFEVIRRPVVRDTLNELDWPRPFDSTRPS